MSLYPCAIHHQSTAEYYWHCTYFIFTEKYLETTYLWGSSGNFKYTSFLGKKGKNIKMNDETYKMNFQLFYVNWEKV